jgi:PAS domain S-box-containing protein
MSTHERETKAERNARPTIALITTEHVDEYPAEVGRGVFDTAAARDVNLLCFVGGRLHTPDGFEAQGNVIYDLVSAESVDGLMIMTSIVSSEVGIEETQMFCEAFHPLPLVSIGLRMGGFPSLVIDNEKGLRDALVHLVEDHAYRRIAFIRGPEANEEADLRYHTYTDVLAKYGVPLDPDLVAPGDFLRPSGRTATSLLLDERKVDFDAIVAANDNMALGALETLQARGIRVPHDVAVVGFDNVQEARFVTPPLTTVRQLPYKLGQQATEMLLALMAGDEVPEQVTLPTEVVIRQSCGCLSPAMLHVEPERVTKSKGQALKTAFAEQRESVLSEMMQAAGMGAAGLTSEQASHLLDAFVGELEGGPSGSFLQALDAILGQTMAAGGDVAVWQEPLSRLHYHLQPLLEKDTLLRAESLWQGARFLVGEMAQRAQGYKAHQADRLARMLWGVGATLLTTFNLEELVDVLAEGLPRLGIPSAYLSLYEDPQPYEYPLPAPEWSRLVLAYAQTDAAPQSGVSGYERIKLEAGGRRFRSKQLVAEGLLPLDRRYSLVVRPLFFQQNQIGLVLFEVSQRELAIYETLSTQISSALRGARLLEDQRRAEETLTEERNLLRTLIDSMPDSVYVKDAESRFILANAEAARRVGVATPDDLVGKTDMDLYPDRLAVGYSADEQELFRTGQPLINREELVIDQTTGERIWNLATKVPLRDSRGGIVGLVGMGRNITQRRQVEEAQQRYALQLQTAAEVSRAAGSLLDLDVLIQQVVDLVRERFALYYVGLFLVDELGKWAVLRAGTGEAGQQMIAQRHRLEVGGTSMIGDCVANKQPRVALDVGEEAVRFDNPFLPDTRSEVALPLISRDEAIGALTIQSAQEAAFSDEDMAVLQIMADQLANAITNARLFLQTQAALTEMERVQRQYLERAWGEFTRARDVVGYEQTPDGIVPTGDEMLPGVEQALEDLGSIVMDDEDGTSVLTVPILLRGQPLGALGIRFDRKARDVNPDDIALVEGIGEQFALAAENLRLLDETQRRAARERLTRNITDKMRRAASIEGVVQAAVDELFDALGTSRAFVRLGVGSDGDGKDEELARGARKT